MSETNEKQPDVKFLYVEEIEEEVQHGEYQCEKYQDIRLVQEVLQVLGYDPTMSEAAEFWQEYSVGMDAGWLDTHNFTSNLNIVHSELQRRKEFPQLYSKFNETPVYPMDYFWLIDRDLVKYIKKSVTKANTFKEFTQLVVEYEAPAESIYQTTFDDESISVELYTRGSRYQKYEFHKHNYLEIILK